MRGRKSPVIDGKKECSGCARTLPVEEFAVDRANKVSGRRASCKQCDNERYDPARAARWRAENREKLRLAAASRYRADKKNLDAQMKHRRLVPRGRAVSLFNSARSRAKKFNMDFNLTHEDIETPLTDGFCEASGIAFDLRPPQGTRLNPVSPSIDRKNNNNGYTKGNVQVVCNMYNCGKGEAAELDFIAMCVAVAERNADRPEVIERLKELRDGKF